MKSYLEKALKKLNDFDANNLSSLQAALVRSITDQNRHCLKSKKGTQDLFDQIEKAYPAIAKVIEAINFLDDVKLDELNDAIRTSTHSQLSSIMGTLKTLKNIIEPLGAQGKKQAEIINLFITQLNKTPAVKIMTLIANDEAHAKEQVKALRVQCDEYKKHLRVETNYDKDTKLDNGNEKFSIEIQAYQIAALNIIPRHLSQTKVMAYKKYHLLSELTKTLNVEDSARDRVTQFKGMYIKNESLLNQDRSPAAMKFQHIVGKVLNESHATSLTNFFFGKPKETSISFNQAAKVAMRRLSL